MDFASSMFASEATQDSASAASLSGSRVARAPLLACSTSAPPQPPPPRASWPKPTTARVKPTRSSRGTHLSSCTRTPSGPARAAAPSTQPSRVATRNTCVSTTIPASASPNATLRMRCAILGPTPGSWTSASYSRGTRPPCRCACSAAARTYLALEAQKLQLCTSRSSSSSPRAATPAAPSPAHSLSMARVAASATRSRHCTESRLATSAQNMPCRGSPTPGSSPVPSERRKR
mmetsp:Transcript_50357/g.161649  ORF Transcript_50357/g.161649 Transcript_50357/m.161649 type:complete len:233 (+) Transcript_50357:81-779(+)